MAEGSAGLAGLLAAAEARMPVESAEVIAFELARRLEARSVSFLITDFTGNAVVRLSNADAGEERERIRLPGTVYGEVLRDQRVSVRRGGHPDGQVQIVAPVTNRGDAIGLLEVLLPQAPEPSAVQAIVESAHALAYILIANRRFTDLYQWGRRTLPMTLAAEIQNTLLPDSLTCEAPQFTISGELIPSEEIAGDTFDHSLDRHTLHVSITDAMGHDVRAALIATLFVGALRSARRKGADLADQAHQAHQALLDHGLHGPLVTGQLLRIDLQTGSAGFVNAGHPWPWLLRGGRLARLTPEIDPPFGAPLVHPHRVQSLQLRPGDRLILVTDGMLERNAAAEDLPSLIEGTRDLHPRETVHTLTQAVLRAQQGVLHDDATVVCLDWQGTRDQECPVRAAERS